MGSYSPKLAAKKQMFYYFDTSTACSEVVHSMKRLFTGTWVFLAFGAIAFFSCQKEDSVQTVEKLKLNEPLIVKDVYVYKDVPVYKNWDIVYQIIETLENNDEDYRTTWEKEMGFVSLKTRFNAYVEEETAFFDDLENEFKEKNTKISENDFLNRFDPILQKYKNTLTKVTFEDGSKYFAMNINPDIYAPIVSENGMMSVNGTIYRYTKKDTRYIPDGNWSKLNELLNDNSTEIEYVEQNMLKNDPPDPDDCDHTGTYSRPTANQWEYSFTDNKDVWFLRTILDISFWQHKIIYWDAQCNLVSYTKTNFYYTVNSFKNRLGIWTRYKANIYSRYEYSGANIASNIGNEYVYDNTFTKTMYATNTFNGNIPVVNDANVWTEVNENYAFYNYTKLRVLNGNPIPYKSPGSWEWPNANPN